MTYSGLKSLALEISPSGDLGELSVSSDPRLCDSCLLQMNTELDKAKDLLLVRKFVRRMKGRKRLTKQQISELKQ